jgi:preprotein translocase subunit SecE
MNKKNILAFINQVKQEAIKVSWPAKSETRSSTMIVIVMVVISSFFFLLVDTLAFKIIQFVLGIGN